MGRKRVGDPFWKDPSNVGAVAMLVLAILFFILDMIVLPW